jgi:hypothetical protein
VYFGGVSLVLLVIVAGTVAFLVGRWWAIAIAPAVGLALGGIIASTGGSLHDTPLPFVVAIATIGGAGALALRRRVGAAP